MTTTTREFIMKIFMDFKIDCETCIKKEHEWINCLPCALCDTDNINWRMDEGTADRLTDYIITKCKIENPDTYIEIEENNK